MEFASVKLIPFSIMVNFFQFIHKGITALDTREVSLLGDSFGLIGTVLATILAVLLAFWQIKKQFEHKIVYEAWIDFQKKLYAFSNAFNDFGNKTIWLKFMVDNQTNPLVNGGNIVRYRLEKWKEWSKSFQKLQQCHVDFLVSYETNEVIFKPLGKMKSLFFEEWDREVFSKYQVFEAKVFPEMVGLVNSYTNVQLKGFIDEYHEILTNVSVFLIDFRTELQNITVGKILKVKINSRKPMPGYKILTQKGFVTQRSFKYIVGQVKGKLSKAKGRMLLFVNKAKSFMKKPILWIFQMSVKQITGLKKISSRIFG